MRPGLRAAGAGAAVLALAAAGHAGGTPGALAAPAGTSTCSVSSHHAAVIAQHSNGGTVRSTVCFDSATVTAKALLDASGIEVAYQDFGSNGAAVCQIDGEPSTVPGDCYGTSSFWAFYVSRACGAWRYSSTGVSSTSVAGGDLIGFHYTAQSHPSPPDGPSGSCPPADASPTPAPTPAAATAAPATSAPGTSSTSSQARPASSTSRSSGTPPSGAPAAVTGAVSSSGTAAPGSAGDAGAGSASGTATATTGTGAGTAVAAATTPPPAADGQVLRTGPPPPPPPSGGGALTWAAAGLAGAALAAGTGWQLLRRRRG